MRLEDLETDAAALEAIANRLASGARMPGLHGDDVLRLWRAEHAIRAAVSHLAHLQIRLHVDAIMTGGSDADNA